MRILFLFFLIFLCSCKDSPTEKHIHSRENILDVKDLIVEIPMEEVLISQHGKMCLLDDYLIIKDNRSPDKLIHLFNKNNFQHIRSTTRIGQGPKEITNLVQIIPDEKK